VAKIGAVYFCVVYFCEAYFCVACGNNALFSEQPMLPHLPPGDPASHNVPAWHADPRARLA
jgi:hypothetical protein